MAEAGKPSDRAAMASPGVPIGRVGGRSFFDYYKKGQGTWTRGGTAVGGGVLVASGCHFLYNRLVAVFESNEPWTLVVQILLPVLVGLVLGVLLWWVVGVNRQCADFFIATEGEVKKVSWSGRKELIGSTKVVIFFTILIAVTLFVVDLVFMRFFTWIGVLRLGS